MGFNFISPTPQNERLKNPHRLGLNSFKYIWLFREHHALKANHCEYSSSRCNWYLRLFFFFSYTKMNTKKNQILSYNLQIFCGNLYFMNLIFTYLFFIWCWLAAWTKDLIQNSVKHLRWSFLQKIVNGF